MSRTSRGSGAQPVQRSSMGRRFYARLIKIFGPATITTDDERPGDRPR